MRKALVILMLSLFTVTQTELGQLMRLPLLADHFAKHRQQDGSSFIDFLKEHYIKDHDDNDQAEDNQLPFKSSFSVAFSPVLIPDAMEEQQPVHSVDNKSYPLNESNILPACIFSIFHPPCTVIS